MNVQSALVALPVLFVLGCGSRFQARPAPEISSAITSRGQPIYVGRVFPLDGKHATPTYLYERRVEDEQDGSRVSTHVTRDLAGAIQLAESATHDSDYALANYTLYANQMGQSGSIRVTQDRVSFRVTDGAREHTAVERPTDAVVVGPTLVGYVFRRLDALERGEILKVRFAVLDRLETIGFVHLR